MSNLTNRNIKVNETPSVYITKFIDEKYNDNEKEFKEVLKTHLINEQAYECMLKDDFDGFIIEREKVVFSRIKELIGIEEPIQGADLTQSEKLEDLIKHGESNVLEFKSSMRAPTKLTDSILSKQRALEKTTGPERTALEQAIIKDEKFLVQSLEQEVFKTVAAFMNSEGGILLIGVDDDGRISGIEKDYETFTQKKTGMVGCNILPT
jgi:hypothetical protein